MPMNVNFFGSEPVGFPQPSRPMFASDTSFEPRMCEDSLPHPFFEGCDHEPAGGSSRSAPEGGDRFVFDEDVIQILREFVEELDDKGRKLFQKLISKVETEIPFERLVQEIRERPISNLFEKLSTKLHDLRNSDADPINMDRGLNIDSMSTGEDLKQKLERFKVKTVNLGIVKEDKK
ncbi:unnamed protein product [Ilex paraguariensis]|uniref:Uncharacterized protein n=1 Tax=Ilex paraguariensis TaxID=185542 RepID=A0ABC8TMB1_9AQUA